MSDLFEDTPTKELPWLLRQISEREIALPDFQRDFVWDPGATEELIFSIASDYPAGSLLAIRNSHSYFQAREFEGAPKLKSKPTYLILDGQQRLTSLYQAFHGRGDYRYFLRVGELIKGKGVDECVFHVRASAQRGWQAQALEKYSTIEGQAKDLVLPLSTIFGDHDGFFGWSDALAEQQKEQEARKALKQQLGEIRKRYIASIETYRFPVVILSDKTPADAVCTIFETLNRTGVKLSVFDLLTARFWPHDVKLRDMWQAAVREFPIITDYEIDPYYILQVISLMADTPSCKRKDVLELKPTFTQKRWNEAAQGMAKALSILRDDCGVLTPKWLPYNTVVVPFAAILAKNSADKGLKAGDIRSKVVRWFWCSVFGQTYESAPNSQSAKDVGEVTKWMTGGKEPESVGSLKFDVESLLSITPRQRAVYSGMICLILARNPRDFHCFKPITRALMQEEGIDDHHVFPADYLEKQGWDQTRLRDCIVNRTLIDRTTNQSISNKSPKSYLTEMRDKLGSSKFKDLMNSHLLPPGGDSPLFENDYQSFLDWRCSKLGELIAAATGLESLARKAKQS